MNETKIKTKGGRGKVKIKPPEERVIKMVRCWYVESLENPGKLLHGPSFKRKKDAIEYAKLNELAVRERLG